MNGDNTKTIDLENYYIHGRREYEHLKNGSTQDSSIKDNQKFVQEIIWAHYSNQMDIKSAKHLVNAIFITNHFQSFVNSLDHACYADENYSNLVENVITSFLDPKHIEVISQIQEFYYSHKVMFSENFSFVQDEFPNNSAYRRYFQVENGQYDEEAHVQFIGMVLHIRHFINSSFSQPDKYIQRFDLILLHPEIYNYTTGDQIQQLDMNRLLSEVVKQIEANKEYQTIIMNREESPVSVSTI